MTTLLEARNESLEHGLGVGVRPRKVFAVEMTWRPWDEGAGKAGRLTRWVTTFPTKALAKRQVEQMRKYPVEGEEVRLLVGEVTWTEEEVE